MLSTDQVLCLKVCSPPTPWGTDHHPLTDCYQVKSCGPCSGPSLAEALCLNKEGFLFPSGFK